MLFWLLLALLESLDCGHITPVSASVFTLRSALCWQLLLSDYLKYLSASPLKGNLSLDLGSTKKIQDYLLIFKILNLITSDKILFPNKLTFIVLMAVMYVFLFLKEEGSFFRPPQPTFWPESLTCISHGHFMTSQHAPKISSKFHQFLNHRYHHLNHQNQI